jgi:heat-inducible transcriptional repressor
MKDLETGGLLAQPHTSAGRYPTDAGFRDFVDRLLRGWPLRADEPPSSLRRRVEDSIREVAGSHALLKVAARQLNQLTANISIVLGPGWDTVRAQRVDLYPKEGGRLLMVLVLENALVRTSLVAPSQAYSTAVLEAAGSLLSERVAGRTVSEIRTDVLPALDQIGGPSGACARELARQGQALFEAIEESEVELEGVAGVLNQPEFSAPDPLKALIRFVESPRSIRETLARLDRQAEGDFGVWIGGENPRDDLQDFGLILGRCDIDGRPGLLAVLGPRRMPYQRAFNGIEMLQRSLQILS